MSRQQDKQTEREWLAIQSELNPGESPIQRTLNNLSIIRAGWHRVRNEKGEWAYFPDVPTYAGSSEDVQEARRTLEDEWESRATQMHANQVPLNVLEKPPEKPTGGSGFTFQKVYADEAPPKNVPLFHESVASTERQRRRQIKGD